MVLGYNQKRPTAKNYLDFLDRLISGLNRIGDGRLSLMVYGSFVRGDYTPGRSDIDAVLTFPHDVVIDKEFVHEISVVLHKALERNNVPFQVSPLDVTIMRDGTFNSFTDEFYNYFQSEGRVVVGPDYRTEMTCLRTKSGEENTLSHNLRKTRQALLFSEHDRKEDYEKFLERFDGSLNAASRGSKQILYLIDGELRKNRFSALKELPRHFPAVNVEPLEQIRDLYHNTKKLDKLYRRPDEAMRVWNSAVTFFEEVIREYIKKFPCQKKHQL
ncbi:nucleotidyltransferase domain-containing protein [Candidatus Woesearchaeota archaeon]|nr:nucleotidyltransferase domain-containing protein [Candidatus Woesearchaeota archaeon]